MHAFYHDYQTRLADKLNSGEILKELPTWITKHTRLNGKPFSFKDHEYMLGILQDQSQEADIMKCSQIGLSELQIRFILSYLHVTQGKTAIYVMPHLVAAKTFTKTRIDSVIDDSPMLKASVRAGSDSSTLKQIGTSFLHIGGAESVKAGISTAAQVLIIDEYDFCNMRVLGIYNSRTRHSTLVMLKRRFSTPTVSNYGISLNVLRSDGHRYMCKCVRCGDVQAPDFYKQVIIPGYDKEFKEFDVEDLGNPRYKVEDAYIACIKCKRELDTSLGNADLREWVPERPLMRNRGYAVKPFDLISHNTTASTILQMRDYPLVQDYKNFVHGEPCDTDENKVNDATVAKCCTGEWLENGNGWYIGIDVGKICHITVGRKMNRKRHVVWFGKVRVSDGDLTQQIAAIMDRFGFARTVVDHGPEITVPDGLQKRFGKDVVHPCVYIKGRKDNPIWYDLKSEADQTGYVNVTRTKGIDSFVQSVNSGGWIFPNVQEMETVRKHLQQMVRVESMNEDGEMEARWTKATDADHYFHSLVYLHTAMELDETEFNAANFFAPTNIAGIHVGPIATPNRSIISGTGTSSLAQMFGRM